MEYYSAIKMNKIAPFAKMWIDLETENTEWSMSEREKQILCNITYMCNLEKWYRWTYLQSRNRDTDVESKPYGCQGRKRGEMKWEIGIGVHSLLCIE